MPVDLTPVEDAVRRAEEAKAGGDRRWTDLAIVAYDTLQRARTEITTDEGTPVGNLLRRLLALIEVELPATDRRERPVEDAWHAAALDARAALKRIRDKIPTSVPRDVDWGDVGDLNHLASTLKELADWYTG